MGIFLFIFNIAKCLSLPEGIQLFDHWDRGDHFFQLIPGKISKKQTVVTIVLFIGSSIFISYKKGFLGLACFWYLTCFNS